MGKLYLSQTYFHIPMKNESPKVPLFRLQRERIRPCLSDYPVPHWFFSRVSNWLAGFLRADAIPVLVYFDNFLLAHQETAVLERQLKFAVHLFQRLCWNVNLDIYSESENISRIYGHCMEHQERNEPARKFVSCQQACISWWATVGEAGSRKCP